jgi:hypothetical protein
LPLKARYNRVVESFWTSGTLYANYYSVARAKGA